MMVGAEGAVDARSTEPVVQALLPLLQQFCLSEYGIALGGSLAKGIGDAQSDLDLYLRLFDATGAPIAANDDRANDTQDPQIETTLLSPGVYHAGVSAAGNSMYDPTEPGSGRAAPGGPYELAIETSATQIPLSTYEPNDRTSTANPMGGTSFTVTGEYIGDGAFGR